MSSRAHEKSTDGSGICVTVRNNDVEKAIRIFKKLINQENVLRDLRKYEFYEKPSVKRRRRKAEAVNRWRKEERLIRDEW